MMLRTCDRYCLQCDVCRPHRARTHHCMQNFSVSAVQLWMCRTSSPMMFWSNAKQEGPLRNCSQKSSTTPDSHVRSSVATGVDISQTLVLQLRFASTLGRLALPLASRSTSEIVAQVLLLPQHRAAGAERTVHSDQLAGAARRVPGPQQVELRWHRCAV